MTTVYPIHAVDRAIDTYPPTVCCTGTRQGWVWLHQPGAGGIHRIRVDIDGVRTSYNDDEVTCPACLAVGPERRWHRAQNARPTPNAADPSET